MSWDSIALSLSNRLFSSFFYLLANFFLFPFENTLYLDVGNLRGKIDTWCWQMKIKILKEIWIYVSFKHLWPTECMNCFNNTHEKITQVWLVKIKAV